MDRPDPGDHQVAQGPQAIATYGSSGSELLIGQVRQHLQAHKIVGPNAAIDTAARVVKAHPELMANAAAVIGALALPMAAFEQRLAETRKDEAVAVERIEEDSGKKCPEPTPARFGNDRPKPRAYQQQITGVTPDLAYFLDGTEFDGCREADGTLLEAKGEGFAHWLVAGDPPDFYVGKGRLLKQAEDQSIIAIRNNWKLEWHFAEKLASEYYGLLFSQSPTMKMIKVVYDPPLWKQ